jgi:hypothetical protein
MSEVRCFATLVMGMGLLSSAVSVAADDGGKRRPSSRDERLEQKLDARLQADALLRSGVDADVKNGVVTLTGTVDNQTDRVRAEQIVRRSGAEKIDNQLAVQAPPARTDAAPPAAPSTEPSPDEPRALSDPQRKDPLVGAMPAERTGSREIRIRTTGMKDPRLEKAEAGDSAGAKDPRPDEARPDDAKQPQGAPAERYRPVPPTPDE